MNLNSEKAKGIFQIVKDKFNELIGATTPAATPTATTKDLKTKDGKAVVVTISDPAISTEPDAGDMVTVDGMPAMEGSIELEDGTVITTDATGAIVTIVAPVAVTQPDANATQFSITKENLEAMYAKFATGTPEERLANIELMVKALMDCTFGYEIRKGQEQSAIEAYKNSLAPVQTVVTETASKMAAIETQIKGQNEVVGKIVEMFEEVMKEPTTEPITGGDIRKTKFKTEAEKKDKKFAAIGEALKDVKKY